MHGDGFEIRQVFLFDIFVCSFGLDGVQNIFFFEKITNQIFLSVQLICEAVRNENKRLCTVTVNSTSIATTLFSLLRVLRFHN